MGNLDYGVLITYLALLVVIGFWAQRKQKDVEDYYVAGRRLGPVTIACLWIAAWIGGAAVVGTTIQLDAQPFTVVGVMAPGFEPASGSVRPKHPINSPEASLSQSTFSPPPVVTRAIFPSLPASRIAAAVPEASSLAPGAGCRITNRRRSLARIPPGCIVLMLPT